MEMSLREMNIFVTCYVAYHSNQRRHAMSDVDIMQPSQGVPRHTLEPIVALQTGRARQDLHKAAGQHNAWKQARAEDYPTSGTW